MRILYHDNTYKQIHRKARLVLGRALIVSVEQSVCSIAKIFDVKAGIGSIHMAVPINPVIIHSSSCIQNLLTLILQSISGQNFLWRRRRRRQGQHLVAQGGKVERLQRKARQ
jgi:hypothetical protein